MSFNPNPDNALQVSHGFIRNAEGDGLDQHRTTASWLYNRPLGEDANFTTAVVWGQNNLNTEGKTNSYLAEADYQRGRNTFFSRIENIQKSGRELVLPEDALQGRKFTLGAYTAGYVRDLTHGTGIDTGLGFAVTADQHPSALNADYGSGTPLSFQIYLRFRPSRMKNMDMKNMDMSAPPPISVARPAATPPAAAPAPAAPMPGMDMPKATPVTVSSITAVIAPSPPKAGHGDILTLTVTGSAWGHSNANCHGVRRQAACWRLCESLHCHDFHGHGNVPPGVSRGRRRPLPGIYQASVLFAMPGPWRVSVTINPSGAGAAVTKALDYAVGQ